MYKRQEYDHLCREFTTYREDLDEIVELMVETVCAKRKTTRIAGSDFPHEAVSYTHLDVYKRQALLHIFYAVCKSGAIGFL